MRVRQLIHELMECNLNAEVLISIQKENGNWKEYPADLVADYDKEDGSGEVGILSSIRSHRKEK